MHRKLAVALGLATALACHHRARVAPITDCHPLPPIGPPGEIAIVRTALRDSTLAAQHLARLVAIVRWTADSLNKDSRPSGALFHFSNSVGDKAAITDSSGFLLAALPAIDEPFHLAVRRLYAQPLDTVIAVRRGFTDTALVYLQANPGLSCTQVWHAQ
jgi:hypothetical protein